MKQIMKRTGRDHFKRFLHATNGAITTDSIIVGAAILGTAIATMAQVRSGVEPLGTEVQTSLTNAEVATLSTLGTNE